MEQKLRQEISKLLGSYACELIDIENVSGMGESYVIRYGNNNGNDKEVINKKLLSLINKHWSKNEK